MNNAQFKKLLKETISHGATSLFEEEDVENTEIPDAITSDDEQDDQSDSTKVVSNAEKELSQRLKQASSFVSKIKNSKNLSVETFPQIIAYYFMAMYYDDQDDWKASLSSTQIFNTNLRGIFKDHEKRNENIVCTFNEALDWVLAYPAYKDPERFVSSLRTKKDQDLVSKLSSTLNKIEKKIFALSSENEKYLKKSIARLKPDFKISDCSEDESVSTAGTATTKDDKDGEKGEAIKEFQKLDLKVGDLVIVKNRKEKEILTTIAEIPEELLVKENQWKDDTIKFIVGGDWSIPLDGKRGFNSKGQKWIAIKGNQVVIRKATPEEIQKASKVDPRVAAKLNIEAGSEGETSAAEEFKNLNLKVDDMVVIKNRKGKEILTTVAEIPEMPVVRENQWKDDTITFIVGGDWSIPLDGKKGFNSRGQKWIAIRDEKIAIRKATPEDMQKASNVDPRVAAKLNIEDSLEDADTEEISREDMETYGTPEGAQAFRPFKKGLNKVPIIKDFSDEIITALRKDIPPQRQGLLSPSSLEELFSINEEEEEPKYRIPNSTNIQAIIKKIASDKLIAGRWAYTLIKRFLSRNGMDLRPDAERNMKSLRVVPNQEDIIPLLKTAKAVERNLEEQRYNLLLKRFNIK